MVIDNCWVCRGLLQNNWNFFIRTSKEHTARRTLRWILKDWADAIRGLNVFSYVGNLPHQFRRKQSEKTASSGSQPGVGTRSSAIQAAATEVGFFYQDYVFGKTKIYQESTVSPVICLYYRHIIKCQWPLNGWFTDLIILGAWCWRRDSCQGNQQPTNTEVETGDAKHPGRARRRRPTEGLWSKKSEAAYSSLVFSKKETRSARERRRNQGEISRRKGQLCFWLWSMYSYCILFSVIFVAKNLSLQLLRDSADTWSAPTRRTTFASALSLSAIM